MDIQKFYKIGIIILLFTTLFFGILTFTGVRCNDRVNHKDQKKEIRNNIDSLEKVLEEDRKKIKVLKLDRVPIEKDMVRRDEGMVELTEKKDEEYKAILADSADVDLVEFNRILTGLVVEYGIR